MPLRNDEFANIKGKMHPTFPGVLRVAIEEKGLVSLSEEITDLRWMEASEQQVTDQRTKQQRPLYEAGWYALAKATAIFRDGEGVERAFTGIGDCGPHNCDRMIAIHAPRMAGTRAKGRVLRDALGLEECLAEEMHSPPPADELEVKRQGQMTAAEANAAAKKTGYEGAVSNAPERPAQAPKPATGASEPPPVCTGCGEAVEAVGKMSADAVARLAVQKYARVLCVPCGRALKHLEQAGNVPEGEMVAA